MSKYKGQHGGKTGSKNSGRGLPPPFSGNAQKKTFFFCEGFPNTYYTYYLKIDIYMPNKCIRLSVCEGDDLAGAEIGRVIEKRTPPRKRQMLIWL